MTSAVGLYDGLKLPVPWQPTTTPIPLIVYGAAGAVGAFAIKLAQASNIHPIIAVAGKGAPFVETLITRSKGDTIVDYRNGDAAVVSGIKDALKKAGATEVEYAYDAVSEKNSYQNICEVLAKGGKITLVLPGKPYKEIPEHIVKHITSVGVVHRAVSPDSPEGKAGIKTGTKEFGYVFFRLFSRGLEEGWFKPHPHQVIPGGLAGIEEGLNLLKDGKVSATKVVFRIDESSKL
jgi:NADPH2:quinone reductase